MVMLLSSDQKIIVIENQPFNIRDFVKSLSSYLLLTEKA